MDGFFQRNSTPSVQRRNHAQEPNANPQRLNFARPAKKSQIIFETSPMMPVKDRPQIQRRIENSKLLKKRAYRETALVRDNNLRIKGPGDIQIVDPEDYLIIGPVDMESRDFYSYRKHGAVGDKVSGVSKDSKVLSGGGREGGEVNQAVKENGVGLVNNTQDGSRTLEPVDQKMSRLPTLPLPVKPDVEPETGDLGDLFHKSDSLDRLRPDRPGSTQRKKRRRDIDISTPTLMLPSLESMVANIPLQEYAKWYPRYRQTVLNSIWGFLNEIRKTYHINENIKVAIFKFYIF